MPYYYNIILAELAPDECNN